MKKKEEEKNKPTFGKIFGLVLCGPVLESVVV